MLVINLNSFPIQVKIDTDNGIDYVHIANKGRVELPEGTTVNERWLALNPNTKVIDTYTAPVAATTAPAKSKTTSLLEE